MNKRHEIKNNINYNDYMALYNRLQAVMTFDNNTDDNNSYRVRSLYFDNSQDKSLAEKLEGVDNREKFRLRYYNEDHSYIHLEKKTKERGLYSKRRIRLTQEECQQIIAGDVEWMPARKDLLLTEFYCKIRYQQLKPKTLIDYKRVPFIYGPGNVRITLDSNIRTGLYSTDFFNPDLVTLPAAENSIIMEIKYEEFLPDIIRYLIQTKNRQGSAFSKYAVCRMFG